MFVIHTKNQPLDIFRLVAMPTFMVTFSILAMQLYLLQNGKTIKEEKNTIDSQQFHDENVTPVTKFKSL